MLVGAVKDYFELFGLDRSFDVDEAVLQSRYLELARQAHPDFAGADAQKQMDAMRRSAEVNEAHRVLADPQLRAEYLLTLLGGSEAKDHQSLPEGFLEHVVEWRTELAEAMEEGDEGRVKAIRGELESQRAGRFRRVGEIFKAILARGAGDAGSSAAPSSSAVRMELNALRYIQRALDQLDR